MAAPEDGWRTSLALCAAPVVLLLCGGAWLPESPRWLHLQGRAEEAAAVLVHRLGRSEDEALLEMASHAPPNPALKQLLLEQILRRCGG